MEHTDINVCFVEVFMYPDFEQNKNYLTQELRVNENFDIVSREIVIGGKKAVFFFIDGFAKMN